MKTPVVLFIFNRPDATKQVINAIRQVRPSQILVIADGPRSDHPDETERCSETRKIIAGIDWDCEVLTNYSSSNLGCKKRISTGLDWVFSQVDEAIILEDDCVPHFTFFQFCEELLEHYRTDSRVMSICGLSVQFNRDRTSYSYYYSQYPHVWGWATWKRAWQYYDVEMKQWSEVRDRNLLMNIFSNSRSIQYWTDIFQATYENKIDTWDYQWILACLMQSGLSIIPSVNLVSNIGFGAEATHTVNSSESSPYSNMPVEAVSLPLKHPPFIVRNVKADTFTQRTYYDCNMSLLVRVLRKMKRILKA
jgi:hypothetical protein